MAITLTDRTPAPNAGGIAASASILLSVVVTGGAPIDNIEVYIEGVLAFDGAAFQAGFDGPGSSITYDGGVTRADIVIDPTGNFAASQVVTVRVVALSTAPETLDTSYDFTVAGTPWSNLSYETAGVGAGVALNWSLTTNSTAEQIAGFGSPEQPAETFDDAWSATVTYTASAALFNTAAIPGGQSVEGFDGYWSGNENTSYDLVSVSQADLNPDVAGPQAEDFENSGWSNTALYFESQADFDSIPIGTQPESFETPWNQIALYFDSVATFQSSAGAIDFEDFNRLVAEWPLMTTI